MCELKHVAARELVPPLRAAMRDERDAPSEHPAPAMSEFHWIREQLQKDGGKLPMPSGN